MHMKQGLVVAAAVWMGPWATVRAEWKVTYLHPPGVDESYASSIHKGQQVGATRNLNQSYRAAMWQGSAASWLQLSNLSGGSAASSVYDGVQAGVLTIAPQVDHAVLWFGTPESIVDIHPIAATTSTITASDDGVQGGFVYISQKAHASVWYGTPESWVDLHPASAVNSYVYDVHGQYQGGMTHLADCNCAHASLWTGSSESWIDLNPSWSRDSAAYAVHGLVQGGSVWKHPGQPMASIWRGSAASWTSLHPNFAEGSYVDGMYENFQVGAAVIEGDVRACIWSDTAESYHDLTQYLNGDWTFVYAVDVWADENTLYVVGVGNRVGGDREALLWSRPIGRPCYPDCDRSGALDISDFVCYQTQFATSDLAADCDGDGSLAPNDFLCFQTAFVLGC